MMTLTLKSHFSSAHLYHQPLWSAEKNREVFGRCYTPYGHGHNYTLEVDFIFTQEDWQNFKKQKQELLDQCTRVLDHEHLNFTVPEFKTILPTTENLVLYFANKLSSEKISSIKVYEMPDLWAQWSAT